MSDKQGLSTRVFGDLSREPDGRPQSLVWFVVAGLFWVWSAYSLVATGRLSVLILLIGVSFALNGVAESLPVARTRVAYLLRVAAIVSILSLFTLLFV
ncbi:MAG: hypothetical protein J07HX64_02189 [halophilic archaeon J07HX64]|jgi:hypothetical protein|nr:MAG: hypothetical protein J07HX64_02189 [halophilic archaeon J07HX64]